MLASHLHIEKGNKILRTLQEKFHHDLLQEKKEMGVTKEKKSSNNRKIERMCVCVCIIQLIYTLGEGIQAQPNFVYLILMQK